METNENVRTMEYMGLDDFDTPVYKCIETGSLWKDVSMGKSDTPVLYSSSNNEFDGEPSSLASLTSGPWKQAYAAQRSWFSIHIAGLQEDFGREQDVSEHVSGWAMHR